MRPGPTRRRASGYFSLAWPSSRLSAGAAAIVLGAMAALGGLAWSETAPLSLPELVELPARVFSYRASGEFTQAGAAVAAPLVEAALPQPVSIMRYQVTQAEYRRCIEAGACAPIEAADGDRPVVRVSWQDADAYAAWLSAATGRHFRLPTDQEWAYAAAERFADDALPGQAESADPGRRALARYAQLLEATGTDGQPDAVTRPAGGYGLNSQGVADIAGNVWEWTDTCYARHALDAAADASTENCFVRVVEGRHRTYLSDFVRTARGGGCSVGIPVANLGFRLVLEREARSS